jgi:hypothetical protein
MVGIPAERATTRRQPLSRAPERQPLSRAPEQQPLGSGAPDLKATAR